jgi:hypothetical protein
MAHARSCSTAVSLGYFAYVAAGTSPTGIRGLRGLGDGVRRVMTARLIRPLTDWTRRPESRTKN